MRLYVRDLEKSQYCCFHLVCDCVWLLDPRARAVTLVRLVGSLIFKSIIAFFTFLFIYLFFACAVSLWFNVEAAAVPDVYLWACLHDY